MGGVRAKYVNLSRLILFIAIALIVERKKIENIDIEATVKKVHALIREDKQLSAASKL